MISPLCGRREVHLSFWVESDHDGPLPSQPVNLSWASASNAIAPNGPCDAKPQSEPSAKLEATVLIAHGNGTALEAAQRYIPVALGPGGPISPAAIAKSSATVAGSVRRFATSAAPRARSQAFA